MRRCRRPSKPRRLDRLRCVILRSLLAAAIGTASLPADALLIRADREDAEYLELATRYPASVRLPAPAGEGVLVGARWVLTAAAPAELLRELKPTPAIRIGAREHEIASIYSDGMVALLYLALIPFSVMSYARIKRQRAAAAPTLPLTPAVPPAAPRVRHERRRRSPPNMPLP